MDAVRMLLGSNANPNIRDESGATSLHRAVSRRDVDAVRVLLGAGADTDIRDESGATSLHRAVSRRDVDRGQGAAGSRC